MNTIEEFKKIIEGNYGITDLKTYTDFKLKADNRLLTQEEIDKLSPDNINSSSFWEYIEKNPEIAKDAISFGATKELDIGEVNKQNFGLACDLSIFNYILKYGNCVNMPILDIGAGYGMLKEFVKKYTKLSYFGVDVYPKIPNVYKVAENGSTLPINIGCSKFGIVVSTNVFQHLSVKQRRHYYEQIANILYPEFGIFSVSQVSILPTAKRTGFKGENNKEYCCHYGQWTEIQPFNEIIEDLEKHFKILSIHQRYNDWSSAFHCKLKE